MGSFMGKDFGKLRKAGVFKTLPVVRAGVWARDREGVYSNATFHGPGLEFTGHR